MISVTLWLSLGRSTTKCFRRISKFLDKETMRTLTTSLFKCYYDNSKPGTTKRTKDSKSSEQTYNKLSLIAHISPNHVKELN